MFARQTAGAARRMIGRQFVSLSAAASSTSRTPRMAQFNNVVAATFCTKDIKPAVKAAKSPGPKKNAEPKPAPEATYEEVLALPKHPETLLVDVREPQELLDTGVIPTSINVPLGEVAKVFSAIMSPKQFKTRFGRVKPDDNVELIFMCMIGRRSEAAAQIAIQQGYTNVKNYRGSWLEWAERNGLPK